MNADITTADVEVALVVFSLAGSTVCLFVCCRDVESSNTPLSEEKSPIEKKSERETKSRSRAGYGDCA